MAKKNNTIIYIAAAAAVLYFLFKKKKEKPKGYVIVDESKHVEFLPKGSATSDTSYAKTKGGLQMQPRKHFEQTEEMNLQPIIGQNEYFKEQYKESLNNCSY